jgi:myo-inositol-1(or 4)-monophosphatase
MAGIVLVREAGGWVSDFLAQGSMRNGGPIVATNKGIRDELVALLKPING